MKVYHRLMSTGLRIAEVARRSGVPPATLRYYEQLGLVSPADRTPAGYRVYDEAALARLAFIVRAKTLGCSLAEISELMPDWDGGRCAPVQERFREVAAAKLVEAQDRITELTAFAGELRQVLATLGTHTPDGPCGDDCGCLATGATRPASPAAPAAPPAIACTLEGADTPVRIRDWRALLTHVTARHPVDDGLRLELDGDTPLGELARLVAAERSCCSFFTFVLTVDDRGLGLEVRAPAGGRPMLEGLLG